jgi:geranylgeranyl transferase type-1 subunit beta
VRFSAHESLAGFTYCAISALSFLERLPLGVVSPSEPSPHDDRIRGLFNLNLTLHWLASRQTATLDGEDAFDTNEDETDSSTTYHNARSSVKLSSFPSKVGEISYQGQPTSHVEIRWTGMNGRCNKIADTCYAFWVCGSLCVSSDPFPFPLFPPSYRILHRP